MRRPTLLLAAALLALTLAACGSSSSNSSPSTTSPASGSTTSTTSGGAATSGSTIHVSIKNLAFVPKVVDAKVGQTVVWSNDDTPPHNVTWVSGPKIPNSSTLNPGATYKVKLTQAGTIHYFCTIHPFMKATIVVSK